MQTTIQKIEKKISRAFGKKVYLLGYDKDGQSVWLETPKWDCGWYWGFGHIERYQTRSGKICNNPENAHDCMSHTHWDSSIIGKHEHYDFEKKCFCLSSDYVHHINENKDFVSTTLTDNESWELSDLMKTFYALKETAQLFHHGHSNLTGKGISLKNESLEKQINEVLLPQVFKRIDEILTPENQ